MANSNFRQRTSPPSLCMMLALLASALCAPVLASEAGDYSDNVFEGVSAGIETPHIRWARPHAGGTLDAVVIAPAWAHRETAELMQRFDFNCRAVMTLTHTQLAHDTGFMAPHLVASRFDAALASAPDLIIIGGVDWSRLLIEHRHQILKRVYEGAGLVYIAPPQNQELDQLWRRQPDEEAWRIAEGEAWSKLSAFAGAAPQDIIKGGRFGEGRWMALRYQTHSTNQSLTPRITPCHAPWEYDFYQGLLGKACLWVAGRSAGVRVGSLMPQRVERRELPRDLGLEVLAADAVGQVSIRPMYIALPSGEITHGQGVDVSLDPRTVVDLPIPRLPGGEYICSAIIRDRDGRTLTWASYPITVTAARRIATLSLHRDAYHAGDRISGVVSLDAAIGDGSRLDLRLWDNHGRLLREKSRTGDSTFEFSFPGVEPLGTCIHRIQAVVADASGVVVARTLQFPIRGRQRPTFHVATWEEPETDYISGLWYRRFRALGVDAIFYRGDRGDRTAAARLIAEADLFSAPSYPGFRPTQVMGDNGPVHDPCMHRPSATDDIARHVSERTAPFTRYDVLFHPGASDNSMRGNCSSPETLAAFRLWLKARYEGLDRLNELWGTRSESWDAIVPDSLEQARQRGQFASWLEHTRFMEESFAQRIGHIRAAIQNVDADPLVGEDGYGRLDSSDGADWWRLLQEMSFYNLYTYQDPPQIEITRSLARHSPGVRMRSLYWGSYDGQFGNIPFMRRLPWYALLHDYNGVFWWVANGKTTYPGTPRAMAGPDFTPTRSYMTSKSGLDEIRWGIAELILGARRQHSGVAIYYDQTVVHANTAYAHSSDLVSAYQGFQDLLEDLGLQYDYLAGAQVQARALRHSDYSVLILAHALAITPGVAEEIRDFTASGGTVIADMLPAQYDELLRPVAGGSRLAGLFARPGEVAQVASGRGVLLAQPVADYPRQRYKPEGRAMRGAFHALLKDVLPGPPVSVAETEDESPGAPGIEITRHRTTGREYLGLINWRGTPQKRTVRLAAETHAYDVRTGRKLGPTRELEVDLAAGGCALFALLDEAVEGVRVSAPADPPRAGHRCDVEVTVDGPPGDAVCRFEVFDPAGKRRDEYCQVIQRGRTHIPFALNDPLGQWRVRATDVVSGVAGETTVDLGPDGQQP